MENNMKFKPVLQERVDKDKENAKKDAELRKEFGIVCRIVTFIATVVIFVLAFIGVAALVHPDSRKIMFDIWVETMSQLEAFLPFL